MLKVENLSKMYTEGVYALKDVSFEIKEGEIVGLIGKNGAGKTTLIKMLSKALKPSEGVVYFNGVDINKKPDSLKKASFMLEPVFYPHLSAYDNLKFYLEANDLTQYADNIDPLLKLVDLYEKRNDNPKSFSFGMKQRLGLVMCLMTEPKLAVLDEPFVGLDPVGVEILIDVLKEWAAERKMSVLISSHQLAELQQICQRYLYIEGGILKDEFTSAGESVTVIEVKNPVQEDLIKSLADGARVDGLNIFIPEANSKDIGEVISFLASTNEIINVQTEKEDTLADKFKGE